MSFEQWVIKKETEKKLKEKLLSQAKLSIGLFQLGVHPATARGSGGLHAVAQREALRETAAFRDLQKELHEKAREDMLKSAEKRRRHDKWLADKENEVKRRKSEQRKSEKRAESEKERKEAYAEDTYKEWLKRNLAKMKVEKETKREERKKQKQKEERD